MRQKIAIAFVPLVDSAVLVAAHEMGFARMQGLDLQLVRKPSWASVRDHLNLGYVDCAHALAPLPVATALGAGHVRVDCSVPFVLSRGGNAFTVSAALAEELRAQLDSDVTPGPAEWGGALAAVMRHRTEPLTFAMVFPFSNHNYDLRYWLAAAGVHPDRDVRLVTVPPPLMVDSLRAGHIDGFCVGEPWNGLADDLGLGEVIVTKSQIFPHSPEKVLAVGSSLTARGDVLAALLRALDAAAAWCDDPHNHARLAGALARPQYVGISAALIEAALAGQLSPAAGRSGRDSDFLYFHRQDANRPRVRDALWCHAQMLRWGQIAPHAATRDAAARVFRPDLYAQACGEEVSTQTAHATAFDGREVWMDDLDSYLHQFELATPFIATRHAGQG